MKHCPKCNESKPSEMFSLDASRSDGLRCYCKSCISQQKSEYRSRNKQKIAEYDKQYRDANQNKNNMRDYMRDYRERNKGKIKSLMSSWYMANKHKSNASRRAREKDVSRATPKWADKNRIRNAYFEAQKLSASGVRHEVDHIIPLRGRTVCGLHCHINLQVIPAYENRTKGNRTWPGMP